MAYTQSNNPFKKLNNSSSTAKKSPLFFSEKPVVTKPVVTKPVVTNKFGYTEKAVNQMVTEGKTRFPGFNDPDLYNFNTTRSDVKEDRHERNKGRYQARKETSDIVKELTGKEISNSNAFNIVREANIGGGMYSDGAIDRIMDLPEEQLDAFKGDIINAVSNFKGLNINDDKKEIFKQVNNLNLETFKKYLDQANVTPGDIKSIISKEVEKNVPKGLRFIVNGLVAVKLSQLK